MLIAQIKNGKVVNVADYTAMFPNTSFPPSGPPASFMAEQGCMYVNTWLPYDPNTQKLQPCTPYISIPDPKQPLQWVYTVEVAQLTPEEKAQLDEQKRQANKAQAVQLLQQTDWTSIPDVGNPQMSNPYLVNQSEFIAYRSQIRAIAVNPPIVVDSWPTQPAEVWSS